MKKALSLFLAVAMAFVLLPAATVPAQAASGTWLWPAKDCYIISSNYGYRDLDGNGSMEATHTGIDIVGSGTTFGQPVLAAKDGTVYSYAAGYGDEQKIWTDDMTSYGNHVILKHNDGTYSIYAHMRQEGIKKSGSVKQGDVIGYIGNSGASSGAHLHFQIFTNPATLSGSSLNPMPSNSQIHLNNAYSLPSGWDSNRVTYIFDKDLPEAEYINRCTFYKSHLTVRVTKTSNMKTLPCSKGTNPDSKDVHTPAIGKQFTVTGMYRNSVGNYWYQTSYKGQTCYIYAGATEVVSYEKDAGVTGVAAPSALSVGQAFSIKGVVSSDLTDLWQVGATIKDSKGNTLMQEYEGVSGSYSLLNSKLDMGMLFNKLPQGWYTYMVYVGERVYYSKDGTTLESETLWPAVHTNVFKVGSPSNADKPVDSEPAKLTDVPDGSYFAKPVEWAVKNGIAEEKATGLFKPHDVCSRAEIITYIWRAIGSPDASNVKLPFKDIPANAYYVEAVKWAWSNGITNGTTATLFEPDATVTRAQAMTFLWRAVGKPLPVKSSPFTDVSKQNYFWNSVMWAAENGITSGTTATTFSPSRGCSRAHVLTFLYNCFSPKGTL